MARWIGATLFLASMIIVSDCQGQLFGNGWVRNRAERNPSISLFQQDFRNANSYDALPSKIVGQPYRFPTQAYYSSGQSKISRLLDGPMTHKYRNPAEVDSRYIGGFHQSHFNNIGIPSGDIGLRGNALNWRTW
jgi:hypothetical protein